MDSLQDGSLLPEYAQSVIPGLELPVLVLISHRHSPPLNPAPRLKFDVRTLPNPPKNIRDAHNGTSKRLQEWLSVDAKFMARRDAIKSEIEEAMTEVLDEHEKRNILKSEPRSEGKSGDEQKQPGDSEEKPDKEEASAGDEEERATSVSSHETSELSLTQKVELRIGVSCAMGRHRSVAMAEELARISWPGWNVRVKHRDILEKRGTRQKGGGKQSRGTRGGTLTYEEKSE